MYSCFKSTFYLCKRWVLVLKLEISRILILFTTFLNGLTAWKLSLLHFICSLIISGISMCYYMLICGKLRRISIIRWLGRLMICSRDMLTLVFFLFHSFLISGKLILNLHFHWRLIVICVLTQGFYCTEFYLRVTR